VRPRDLLITNLTTGQNIGPDEYEHEYDPTTLTATWTYTDGLLPDGNYRATLSPALADRAGNPMDGNADGVSGDAYTINFFQLAADANLDRVVDHLDFQILRENFGHPGSPEQGDFTADALVDFRDFQILERHYANSLPEPQPAAALNPKRPSTRPLAPPPLPRRFSANRIR
jgi:hypothetical protein